MGGQPSGSRLAGLWVIPQGLPLNPQDCILSVRYTRNISGQDMSSTAGHTPMSRVFLPCVSLETHLLGGCQKRPPFFMGFDISLISLRKAVRLQPKPLGVIFNIKACYGLAEGFVHRKAVRVRYMCHFVNSEHNIASDFETAVIAKTDHTGAVSFHADKVNFCFAHRYFVKD